jgi:arsenite-transporting ATPase
VSWSWASVSKDLILSAQPQAVPGAPGLEAMNIDPDASAEAYRHRVIA